MTFASANLAADADDDSLAYILSSIVVLNSAVLAQTLLYGIHIVLFGICVYILVNSRRSVPWYSLISAFLLFSLSTADIALTIRLCVHELPELYLPGGSSYLTTRLYPKNPFFVTNNFIATLTLLYRCYVVWHRIKYVVITLASLVLLDTVWGYLALVSPIWFDEHKFVSIYVWSIFGLNVITTGLIVGRVFWVARRAGPWMGDRQVSKYHVAIAILMESSAVYSACLLGYILYPAQSRYRVVVISLCMRLVSIVPTLLVVQAGLSSITRPSTDPGTTTTEVEHQHTYHPYSGEEGTSVVVQNFASATHRRRSCFIPQGSPNMNLDSHDIDITDQSSTGSKRPSFSLDGSFHTLVHEEARQ